MNNLSPTQLTDDGIAIIGLSGRFPGAKNVDEFWQNLKNGVESISFFSDQELLEAGIDPAILADPSYVKAKGVLENVTDFDAAFFGLSPTEAEITDPQQRLFLECAWEALENAGYDPKTYSDAIGVYGGVGGHHTYFLQNLYANTELRETLGDYPLLIGNDKDFLCTRISYKLNLRGPSITVQTACSSSLVAVVMGCQSLLDYQCDLVLAGGAAISLPIKSGYFYKEGMILSPDGHCRAFDAKAQGTVAGNGVGIVVLKRVADALRDGDYIYAVIRGAAINNDGASKVGYTAPSVDAQARVIAEALSLAEVSADTISYVETHGTGTPMGDPVEIAALTKAFRDQTDKAGYCAIGSVKTNVGHLDAAAGVTGLIKTVLALHHQLIPPSLHFENPNPKLNLAQSPFYVNTRLADWKTSHLPRYAGVSSFGVGGTNAHVVLEEAPPRKPSGDSRPWQLLMFSAKTAAALETATIQLLDHLKLHPHLKLADVAYTYQVGRGAFNHRRILACQTLAEAVTTLETRETKHLFTQMTKIEDLPVVFMFSGQGAQHINMGLELYQTEPTFREKVDYCAEFLKPHLGMDLRMVLYQEEVVTTSVPNLAGLRDLRGLSPPQEDPESLSHRELLTQTSFTQPALFAIEYALAHLWMSWGIQPKAMIGHSIGEYVAACLAGVFTLEEALVLVTARGRLMQSIPPGTMLAVPLAEEELRSLLPLNVDIATINVPSQTVVSGPTEIIAQLAAQLATQGLECQTVHTSHAFHSDMMSPILPAFLEEVQKIQLRPPQIPYLSNLTGTWITSSEATDPHYWVKHLRHTVRFAAGLQQIFTDHSKTILLEVGPGRTLSTFAKRHPDKSPQQVILSSLRHPKDEQSDSTFLLTTLGQLWLAGVTINWSAFYVHEQRYRLPLPTYPFERQRYWLEIQQPSPLKLTKSSLWQPVIEAIERQAQAGIAEFDNPAYVEKYQWLNHLCGAYVHRALQELGVFSHPTQRLSVEEIFQQFHILPFYQQTLSRYVTALVEQGHLQREGEQFTHLSPLLNDSLNALNTKVRAKWTGRTEWIELVQLCGTRLAGILTGQENPRELLFTGPAFEILQRLYQHSPESRYFNTMAQAGIKQIVKSFPSERPLRILEVGAGTGATTTYLLPELPPQRTYYVFTDVGPSFLTQAQQKFHEYPFLEYRVLNIEQAPHEQGYESHSFDVIIAAQVLHATKNLGKALEHVRSLLAPEGILLLWEPTRPEALYFDVAFPLMQPFEQADKLRSQHPFLTTVQWYEALRNDNFVEVAHFPKTETLDDHFFVAQVAAATAKDSTVNTASTTQVGKRKPDIADWFYLPSWKRTTLPKLCPTSLCTPNISTWLVLVDECGLGAKLVKKLEAEGQDVIMVSAGQQFIAHSDRAYTLNPGQPDDYLALLQALRNLNQIPKRVVHLWRVTPDQQADLELERLDEFQNLGFYSLFYLAQALGNQNLTEGLQIVVVSNHLHEVTGKEELHPEKATLLGAVKVIPQEYFNCTCLSIDIVLPEPESKDEQQLLAQLWHELTTRSTDTVIAYRNQHRWVQTFEPIRLEDTGEMAPRLREQGVYLITGGLGNIGLVLAEYLAKTVRAKLILVSRSPLPAREAWEHWLNTHDAQDGTSFKIRKVQALEALGSTLLICSADVANYEQMQTVLAQAQEQFGQLQGVIHAAGIADYMGIIQKRTRAMTDSILAPKVRGTLILEKLLKGFQLDFFVLCSSLGSLLSRLKFGQVGTGTANEVLDAFPYYNKVRDDVFTVTINWTDWQAHGMAWEAQKHWKQTYGDAEALVDSIAPWEGIEIFKRVLAYTFPRVVVSTQDIELVREQASALIARAVPKTVEKANLSKSKHPRPVLGDAYLAPRNDTEKVLTDLWQAFFSIEPVGIHDNFFDLGGDSLLAVQLIAKVRKTFQVDLPAHSVLESPTIAELAGVIIRKRQS